MEFLGYLFAVLVGLVLGLFGSGGAIIAFPVLVYFMKVPPSQASIYSLIIVGIASAFGLIKKFSDNEKDIQIPALVVFSIPLLISFYLFKLFILKQIPNKLFHINNWIITKNLVIMILFFTVLSFIIYKMIYKNNSDDDHKNTEKNQFKFSFKFIVYAAFTGILAASIGAGGGFLIVPALMETFNMSIKKATTNSLAIITINSILGTWINQSEFSNNYLSMITLFALMAVLGIFIGTYLNKIILTHTLQKFYAYFLLLILILSLFAEIYKNYLSIQTS